MRPFRAFIPLLVSGLAILLFFAAPPLTRAQAPQGEKTSPSAAAQSETRNQEPGTQIQPGTSRPKIGVALEGGGALGLAHIGVLQWFEDHHIPIDYIAGTSMGGLVGGLYATGRSPEELKEIVAAQNWDIIIGGDIAYQDLSYRRKEDLRYIQNSLKLGLKHGLSTPSGLNSGTEISLLIDRETVSYPSLDSFDHLPIPFRCVATDLVSGKEVVFSSGSLQQALRATMSMPGVFSPVRDGDKIYVDGGLVGNLPTDVVKKMGADIVIAVHLEVAPGNPREIQSLFSVLGRSVDVVVLESELRGLKNADIVVTVPLEKYNGFEYDRAAAIIQEGTQAAEQKKAVLSRFSASEAEWNAYVSAKEARIRTEVPTPQFVEVEGTNPRAAQQIERFLNRLVGHPIDNGELNQLLIRLFLTDHRDDFIAPRRGYSVQTTFRWYDTNPGARDAFPVMEAQVEYFTPITKPGSLFVVGQGGTTFGSNNIGVPQFFLGGPTRLSAYGSNELFGNQYYYFRAGYLHDVFALPPFVGKNVYVIGAYEFGKMYNAPNASKFPNDAALGFLAETSIGPLFIGGSVGDTGHAKWFFELGHVF